MLVKILGGSIEENSSWWYVWLTLYIITIIYYRQLHQTKTKWVLSAKFKRSQRNWFCWCFTGQFFWNFLTFWCSLEQKTLQFFLHFLTGRFMWISSCFDIWWFTLLQGLNNCFHQHINDILQKLWNLKITISKSCIYDQMYQKNNLFKNKCFAAGLHWLEGRLNVSIVWCYCSLWPRGHWESSWCLLQIMYLPTILLQFEQILVVNICLILTNT